MNTTYRIRRNGALEIFGTMPNSNQVGWYLAGWAADLAHQLMIEAAEHGDWAQVAICRWALAGSKRALRQCARVIAEARSKS